jgi:hypothetical protein
VYAIRPDLHAICFFDYIIDASVDDDVNFVVALVAAQYRVHVGAIII